MAPRHRLRRRGAALTEALIVACVMMVFLGGIFFMHQVADAKGDALRAARYRAWEATRPGCAGQITGTHTRQVAVPAPLTGASALSVGARTSMMCNEEPHDQDDMLSVLEWATTNGFSGFLEPALDTIMGFFHI